MGNVIFSKACVKNSADKLGVWWGHAWQGGMCGRRACMAGECACRGGGVHSKGHAWQGACVAGGMHGGGGHGRGHAWWGGHLCWGVCVAGGVHGGGCMAVGMLGGGMHGRGTWVADTMRYGQRAGGTHPTGMYSRLKLYFEA